MGEVCLDPFLRFFEGFVCALFCFKERDGGDAVIAGVDYSVGVESGYCSEYLYEFSFDFLENVGVEFFDGGFVYSY